MYHLLNCPVTPTGILAQSRKLQTRCLQAASGKELLQREWLLPSGDDVQDSQTRATMRALLLESGVSTQEADAALVTAARLGAKLHGHPALPLLFNMLEPGISKRAVVKELLRHDCLVAARQRMVLATPVPEGRDDGTKDRVDHLVQLWREEQQQQQGVPSVVDFNQDQAQQSVLVHDSQQQAAELTEGQGNSAAAAWVDGLQLVAKKKKTRRGGKKRRTGEPAWRCLNQPGMF
jgi:hypothetical protein